MNPYPSGQPLGPIPHASPHVVREMHPWNAYPAAGDVGAQNTPPARPHDHDRVFERSSIDSGPMLVTPHTPSRPCGMAGGGNSISNSSGGGGTRPPFDWRSNIACLPGEPCVAPASGVAISPTMSALDWRTWRPSSSTPTPVSASPSMTPSSSASSVASTAVAGADPSNFAPPPGPYSDYLFELLEHLSVRPSGGVEQMVRRTDIMFRHYHYLGDLVMKYGDDKDVIRRALLVTYEGDAMVVSATMDVFFDHIRIAQHLIANPQVLPAGDMVSLWWIVAMLDTAIMAPVPWVIAKTFVREMVRAGKHLFDRYSVDPAQVLDCFERQEALIRVWLGHSVVPLPTRPPTLASASTTVGQYPPSHASESTSN